MKKQDGFVYKSLRHAAQAFARRYMTSLGGGWFYFVEPGKQGRKIQGLWHVERLVERYGSRLGYGKWFLFTGLLDAVFIKGQLNHSLKSS